MSDTTKLLICPACGAPLDPQPYEATVKCNYCGNSTILPQSMRTPVSHGNFATSSTGFNLDDLVGQAESMKEVVDLVRRGNKIEAIKLFRELTGMGLKESKEAVDAIAAGQPFALDMGTQTSYSQPAVRVNTSGSRLGAWIGCGVTLLVLFIVGGALFPVLASIPFLAALVDTENMPPVVASVIPQEVTFPLTSSFAKQLLSFGDEGSGPGLFDDPRHVAVDGDGFIYVGDYQDGRVQIFDQEGNFQRQINIGDTILRGMAVSPGGDLYLVYDGKINIYNSGGQQDVLAYEGYVDDIALGSDRGLYAVTGGETLLRFDSDGNLDLEIPDAISTISNDSELNTRIAVDGLGNIYALGTFNEAIFIFNPAGNFVDRFGGENENPARGVDPGHFQAAYTIAVDGYGRIYVSDIWGIQVFDSEGQYLDLIDVEGVAFGMTFDLQNNLYIASNTPRVFKYEIEKP